MGNRGGRPNGRWQAWRGRSCGPAAGLCHRTLADLMAHAKAAVCEQGYGNGDGRFGVTDCRSPDGQPDLSAPAVGTPGTVAVAGPAERRGGELVGQGESGRVGVHVVVDAHIDIALIIPGAEPPGVEIREPILEP